MDWVTLSHPETGATHSFPATEGALAGAKARGWVDEAQIGDDSPAVPSDWDQAVADGHNEED